MPCGDPGGGVALRPRDIPERAVAALVRIMVGIATPHDLRTQLADLAPTLALLVAYRGLGRSLAVTGGRPGDRRYAGRDPRPGRRDRLRHDKVSHPPPCRRSGRTPE
jgi:hypothetical protein